MPAVCLSVRLSVCEDANRVSIIAQLQQAAAAAITVLAAAAAPLTLLYTVSDVQLQHAAPVL